MSTRTVLRLTLVAALASIAIACRAAAPIIPGPAMPARDTVVISDSPYAAYVGSPVALGARVWLEGAVVPDAPIEWSASPGSVARIARDGTLTPMREGHVIITARVGGVRTTRVMTVQPSTRAAVVYARPSIPAERRKP
ncbi:MAG: hypothetical protein HOQ11_17970 [Gemmatimonadaceae bacterium]|nr:hypothetical protein [Gemmatimonadaceae bacterium]NUQ92643.1 hypothetical protein [Gemmatimonadaceae bacterium]NUR20364.1 hypothetical protein [Gemmatimonadaceae bacterium]NUS99294.1 hypothetical protein [Gemmatimonadaceae bacterium]